MFNRKTKLTVTEIREFYFSVHKRSLKIGSLRLVQWFSRQGNKVPQLPLASYILGRFSFARSPAWSKMVAATSTNMHKYVERGGKSECWENIIKDKIFSQSRNRLHKGRRDRKHIYSWMYITSECDVIKKKWNTVICTKMDKPRWINLEVNQKEKNKYQMIALICGN